MNRITNILYDKKKKQAKEAFKQKDLAEKASAEVDKAELEKTIEEKVSFKAKHGFEEIPAEILQIREANPNLTWEQAFISICVFAYVHCDMPSSNAVWSAYLRSRGYRQYSLPLNCPECYTLQDFCCEHVGPAYAGMILNQNYNFPQGNSRPRVCGDDPIILHLCNGAVG